MKFVKSLLIITILAIPAVANSQPYDLEPKIERVGLKELQNISKVNFESGNNRLDPDFRLGYGDSVIIRLWGKLDASYNLTIGKDGDVVIPLVGRVKLFGLTMDQAYNAVMSAIDRKYSNVDFDINLADVKDIRINILGYLQKPGPYAISPFCRVVEALAKSSGPNDKGSIIDIRLIRDGKMIVSFNAYEFIFKGDESKNIRLKQGDTIFIPKIKNLITLQGDIRYPGTYEAEGKVLLTEIIDTAGGMLPTELKRKIYVLRSNPENKRREIFKEIVFEPSAGIGTEEDVTLKDGDSLIFTTAYDSTPSTEDIFRVVHITGEIKIPGDYLIKKGEMLNSLLKRAEGLRDRAFGEGAVFTRNSIKQKQTSILDELIRAQERAILQEEARLAEAILPQDEKEMRQMALEYRRKAINLMASRTSEGRIIIDLQDIIDGKADITLEKGDNLYVPPIPDWVIVAGAVYNPQSVFFKNGKDFNYYISTTGGLTSLADSENIYVIKADGSAESKSTGFGVISRGDIIIVPEK